MLIQQAWRYFHPNEKPNLRQWLTAVCSEHVVISRGTVAALNLMGAMNH